MPLTLSAEKPSQKPDNRLTAFYDTLSQKERLVHELAATMLKTRYNPLRCNLFKRYVQANP